MYRPGYYVLYTELYNVLYTVLHTILNTALCTVLCTLIYNKLNPDIKVASQLKCFLKNTSPLPSFICRYKFIHRIKNYTVNFTASVLGREEGYADKYTPSPEGVPGGKARVNS